MGRWGWRRERGGGGFLGLGFDLRVLLQEAVVCKAFFAGLVGGYISGWLVGWYQRWLAR